MKVKIGPSLLSCDFSKLAEQSDAIIKCGADELHVDVMDGHFVPNITLGAPIVKSLHSALPNAFLDCHLMVTSPEKWVSSFAEAGASLYTFHIEAVSSQEAAIELINDIRSHNMKVGISIKPKTPVKEIESLIKEVDRVLVMTVEPGFGGQSFMEDMMDKIKEIRLLAPFVDIQVDGGINDITSKIALSAGANCLVAGSYVFKSKDYTSAIKSLR
ncbi:Ribulose-phosphate 3-epimerase [Entamoeba marina]